MVGTLFICLNEVVLDKQYSTKRTISSKIKPFITDDFLNINDKGKRIYKYLNNISKKINTFKGGLLIIDYGYLEKKMKNSLQSVRKHKFSSILKDLGNSDITYNVNFNLLKKITKKLNLKVTGITSQKNFLTKLGIMQRAEILAKNLKFSKKADIYYRLNRLIDNKFMGDLFKVMFVTKKNNKFKIGFEN